MKTQRQFCDRERRIGKTASSYVESFCEDDRMVAAREKGRFESSLGGSADEVYGYDAAPRISRIESPLERGWARHLAYLLTPVARCSPE